MEKTNLRTEQKYDIALRDFGIIGMRLRGFAETDTHSGADGSYLIRSVYFDDPGSSAYFDKAAGVPERKKYRVRFYNFDDSFIVLEKKEKIGDKSRKTSVRIEKDTLFSLFDKKPVGDGSGGLLDEFDAFSRGNGLFPSVVVDYRRKAFFNAAFDTRITLDSNVHASRFDRNRVFDPSVPSVPVEYYGRGILEIKYNGFFLSYFSELLEDIPKARSANSKFFRCAEVLL